MNTLTLLVVFLTIFGCSPKKSYRQIPRLSVENGHFIFYAAYGKNITFRTTSSAGVSINDIDILTMLNGAHNATSLVKSYQETFASYVDRIDSLEQRVSDAQIQWNNSTDPDVIRRKIKFLNVAIRSLHVKFNILKFSLDQNECDSNPCKNGGTCQDMFQNYICRCPNGWEGTNCEEDVNECSRFSGTDLGCQNGATCVNKPGTYECRCKSGFVGLHCTRGKADCSIGGQELCGHGVCVQQQVGYNCICDQGWTTDGTSQACTVDVNECNLNHPACSKSPSVACINVPGSFYCGGCPAGYTGNGYYCADINECEINNGGCSLNPSVACLNTRGSRMCGPCPSGYAGDGVSCVFKGVCHINNGGCHYFAQCRDNPRISSTYVECVCPAGYVGNGVGPEGCTTSPKNLDPCAPNPCAYGACSPNNLTGEYVCSCNRKFTGRNCDIMKDPCASSPCQNGGTCLNLIGISFRCVCNSGFTGTLCEDEKEGCGGAFSGPNGTLEYPPDAYESFGHRISCSWTIETNSTRILNITFSKFNIEASPGCGSSWLQVHDGPDSASRLLGRFCGTDLPLGGKISTTTNIVYLWFIANAEKASNEFNLTWNTTDPVCGGEITTSSHGTIESPGSPGNYPPNRDCYWHLVTPVDKRLQFHFFSLDIGVNTGCDSDFIEFYSTLGNEDDAPFAKFCNSSLPMPFLSLSHDVKVHFHSDGENSYPGFQLTYSTVTGTPGCGGFYSAKEGTVRSAEPEHDGKELVCEYKFNQGSNARTKVTFLSVDLGKDPNCLTDYIEIREGLGEDSPLVGRYCGSALPPPYISNGPLTIISATNLGKKWKLKYEKLCGTKLFNQTGSFSSSLPGQGNDCIYQIVRPVGHVIVLTIKMSSDIYYSDPFCSLRYVAVWDGDREDAPLLKRLCKSGTEIITSTHNHLWIRYYDSNYRYLTFKAEYTSREVGCGGILRNKTGTIAASTSKRDYVSLSKCSWVIISPPEFVIRLTWVYFNLDSYSSLEVFDNDTDLGSGELVGKFTGSKLPPMLSSMGNIMTIVYKGYRKEFLGSYAFVHESNVCGANYYTSGGIIKSPNYPASYPSNLDCTWKITVPSGQQILLNVTDFELESYMSCHFDWLEIRDGSTSHSPLIGKYCSAIPKLIPSHANELYLHFKTDGFIARRGFKIRWFSAATGCGGRLTSPSASFTSPEYPEPYSKNVECTWQITVASGTRVQVIFLDVHLKGHGQCDTNNNDIEYVQIFDGLKINSKSLGFFCSKPDKLIVSSDNKMLVKFRSSFHLRGRGFNLYYSSFCNNTLTGFRGVIESPNFHDGDSQELNCLWDIIVNDKNKINITFTHLDVGTSTENVNRSCGSSYVELKYFELNEDNYELETLTQGKYCGSNNPGLITINSDHAQIHFVSTGTGRGFRLEWQLFGCGGVLTYSSGTIQSPNYPNRLPPTIKCQWRIEVELGYSIQLYFREVDLSKTSCYYSYVQVFNGPNNSSTVLSNICHLVKPAVVTSTGNQMFIDFQSQYNSNGRGFIASYSAAPTKCGGKFTVPEGTISSPNYPDNFDKNDNCYWLIKVEEGHTIELTFEDVDLPEDCNKYYIKVYDGSTETRPVLETVCNVAPNETISSTFNQMYIAFRTDTQATKGFLAKYKKSCGSRIVTKSSGNIQVKFLEFEEYTTCTWTIVSEDPARHIILTITRMQTTAYSCDYSPVKIFGGETIESPLVKSYCEPQTPVPIISDGSALTIQLALRIDFFATYSVFDSHCGGTFDSIKGFFASPGYPDKYPSDMQCEWTLRVAPGNKISLSFHEFDLLDSENCDMDFLEIRKHNVSGALLGVYCGKNKPLNITHEGALWMFFKGSKLDSDTTVAAKGFYGEYELDVDSDLTGPKGVIASPLYPKTYYSKTDFSWKITVGPNKRILLTFNEFYMFSNEYGSCFDDSMIIYDGADSEAPVLGSFCDTTLPDPIKSSTNTLYIKLHMYSVGMGTNFLMEWLEISGTQEISTNATASTDQNCGSPDVIDMSGRNDSYHITSPGYPYGYESNLSCEWIFSTIPMNHLSVDVEDISLSSPVWSFSPVCTQDFVNFYQKGSEDNDWILTKTVCRKQGEYKNLQFTNLLKVQFVTNENLNRTGFKAAVYQKCGGSMEGPTGVIYVNATSNYGFDCEWNVTVRTARTIKVTFEKMQIDHNRMNGCENYVMLRNGKYPDSPLLGNGIYCGTTVPEPLNTTGNSLHVKYKSFATTGGFVLKYQEISVGCGNEIILSQFDSSVEINSPNYPNIPHPHTECTWMIRAPPGDSLRVDFEERFDLTNSAACGMEYVELRDGSSEFSPFIGRYCREAPGTQFSTDSVIFVKFFTDTKVPRNGFKAKISLAYCGGAVKGYRGHIESPRQNKDPKVNCTWHIVGPVSHYLNIRFVELKLDASGNKITILEKNPLFNNVTKLGEYNGTVLPPPLTTSSNEAVVNYIGSPGSIFRLNFNASKTRCGGTLRAESGEITSPGYPLVIHQRVCRWSIEVPSGRRITFNFVDLDLDSNDNGILLYDGSVKTSILLAILLESETSNRTFETSSNTMAIIFWSHDFSYHRGFKASFSSDKPTICSSDFTADSGVLTQPDSRNGSYWCRWTHHNKNTSLNRTFALTISLQVNATKAVPNLRCKTSLWAIEAANQEDRILVSLCPLIVRNYVVRSPFPVTKLVAFASVQMNFTVSYNTHDCGGILNKQEGFLSSPNFPNKSSHSVECAWLVQVDKEQTVNLTVLSMDLGNDCDKSFVAVYNGNGRSHPRIGKYCGTDKPDGIISQSDSLWIEYRYEVGSTGAGFRLRYEAESLGCGGVYHDRERFIRTPNYNRDYPNNAECVWEIRATLGYFIRLHFIERFQIETSDNCASDYVEVWNWKNDQWTSIVKVCGRNNPYSVQSTGDRMRIIFRSDNRTTGSGFKAKWEWICGGTLEATGTPHTVVSPGYPLSYTGNLNCMYKIISKTGVVNFHFDDFELESEECNQDNVTITELYSLTQTYCGTRKPPPLRRRNIVFTFKTNPSGNKKGFKFTYRDDGCDLNITRETVINGPSLSVQTHDRFIVELVSCSWKIVAPPKQVVVLRIISIDTQRHTFSNIDVYKGLSEKQENKLASLFGSATDLSPIFADSGSMLVKLRSNTNYYKNFKAQVYFTHGPSEGCGGTINLTETKYIQAPDLENLDCGWKIKAPLDYQIQVHFTELDLPGACTDNSTLCSFVEVRDGMSPFSELIEKLDSKSNARPEYRKFSTSVNGCHIRLLLTGRRSSAFKATLTPVISKCGPFILNATTEAKTLTSPNYPDKYPPNIACNWEITVNNSWDTIELHFTDFNLTGSSDGSLVCNGDRVIVAEDPHRQITTEDVRPQTRFGTVSRAIFMDYNYYSARHTFCGNLDSVFDYYSVQNFVTVTFKSLLSPQQGRGFKLEYRLTGCNRNYTSPQGYLYSPRHRSDCVITISVPENRTISLYFDRFFIYYNAACRDTGFEVRDGAPDGQLLSHSCGSQLPDPVFSFSNKLYLHVYNSSKYGATFGVGYTSTDAGRGCGGELYAYRGRVSSPLYPNQFRNDTVCRWVIKVPVELYAALKFHAFDIQGSCDQTYVRITTYLNNKLIRTFCQHDNPAILRSNSRIDIEYRSSTSNGGKGWLGGFLGLESETADVR